MPPTTSDAPIANLYKTAALDLLKKPPKRAKVVAGKKLPLELAPYAGIPKSLWEHVATLAAEVVEARLVPCSRPWALVKHAEEALPPPTDVHRGADRLRRQAAALALDVAKKFVDPPVLPTVPDSVFTALEKAGRDALREDPRLLVELRGHPDEFDAAFACAKALALLMGPQELAVGLNDDDIDRPITEAAAAIRAGVVTAFREAEAKKQAEKAAATRPEEEVDKALEEIEAMAGPFTPVAPRPPATTEQLLKEMLELTGPVAGTELEVFLEAEGLGAHLNTAELIDRFDLARCLRGTPRTEMLGSTFGSP